MDKLVYLAYPVMLAVLLTGSKLYRKNQWNEEFMTLEQTKYLQGFFALCIMLHHIGQETCASWNEYPKLPGLELFVPIGYFFVSLFLLCSGYGLFKSFKAKEDYFKGFFVRRILPLILIFFITGWIYFVARILMHESMNSWKIFCYISGWGLPNLYAWFVIAMTYFYICFYVSFKYGKSDFARIAGVIAGVFIYTFIGTYVNHNDYWMRGEWWYNCVHLFWIGMLFARYENQIITKVKKRYSLYLILSIVFTVILYFVSEIAQGVFSYYGEYNIMTPHYMVVINRWICLITQMLASFSFVVQVLLINMKLKIGNRVLGFMGTITLEFYMIHGLILEFFSYNFCDNARVSGLYRIENVALLIIVVLIPSIFMALGLKKIIEGIQRKLISI